MISGKLKRLFHALLTVMVVAGVCISQISLANQSQSDSFVIYYHHDMRGDPVVVTDDAANTLWIENHRPFGAAEPRMSSAGLGFGDSAQENQITRFGLTGHIKDSTSGLTYMKLRYYDPLTARFASNDPVSFRETVPGSFNRYSYVLNNPYRYSDPTGANEEETDNDGGKTQAEQLQELNPNSPPAHVDQLNNAGQAAGRTLLATATAIFVNWVTGGFGLGAKSGKATQAHLAADAAAATSKFAGLKYGQKYGFDTYDNHFKNYTQGKKGVIQSHHLIEKRFADQMGQDEGEMLSVVVTQAEHTKFTNAWARQINRDPKASQGGPIEGVLSTSTATKSEIENAAREIYTEYPEILKVLGL